MNSFENTCLIISLYFLFCGVCGIFESKIVDISVILKISCLFKLSILKSTDKYTLLCAHKCVTFCLMICGGRFSQLFNFFVIVFYERILNLNWETYETSSKLLVSIFEISMLENISLCLPNIAKPLSVKFQDRGLHNYFICNIRRKTYKSSVTIYIKISSKIKQISNDRHCGSDDTQLWSNDGLRSRYRDKDSCKWQKCRPSSSTSESWRYSKTWNLKNTGIQSENETKLSTACSKPNEMYM